MTVHGSCLCGDVAWEADGHFEFMHHCHCTRCQKTHGTAYATDFMCKAENARLVRGGDQIERFASSPGTSRKFCRRCGSIVTDGEASWQDFAFLPAGSLDDDPGIRPIAHIFVASKAPWFDIRDDLPKFEAFPTGVEATVLPDLEPPLSPGGTPRGSCLCGGVAFVVEGIATRAHHCHCSRCRKVSGAAHASNLFTTFDGVRVERGQDLLVSYKLPEARDFTNAFCRRCGSRMPRFDAERGIAVVPLGGLDDAPSMRPQSHIFVGSKAPWSAITDDLPRFEAGPHA